MLSNCGAGEDSRVPWTARRSNLSILKEINFEYSLEGLKLKLQYFGHLMWRANPLEKTLMLGKIEGRRIRGRQRMRWLMASLTQWTWVWVNAGSRWWKGKPGVLQSVGSQKVGHNWVTELKWTEKAKIMLEMRKSSVSKKWKNNVEGNLVQDSNCSFLVEILANSICKEY